MPAECQLEVHSDPCGLLAIERCNACSRAYCASHRAWQRTDAGVGLRPYYNWCTDCQAAHRQAEEDKEVARVVALKADAAAGARRQAELIRQFRTGPFVGAKERFISRREKRPFPLPGYKTVRQEFEPAVPLGELYWRYTASSYYRDFASIEYKEGYSKFMTGLTGDGHFVLMDTDHSHQTNHRLGENQHEEICSMLERVLVRRSRLA